MAWNLKLESIPSLELTYPMKIHGWKMNFLLGFGIFSGAFAVSFRECITQAVSLA